MDDPTNSDPSADPEEDGYHPNRPPVAANDTETTPPFDPFEAARVADGGAIRHDSTELQFQLLLPGPDPETPNSPTIEHSESEEGLRQPATDGQSETGSDPTRHSSATGSETAKPDDGLVESIRQFTEDVSLSWGYNLTTSNTSMGVTHHLQSQDHQFTIQQSQSRFEILDVDGPGTQPGPELEPVCAYPDFPTAFAAVVERVDWGTFPTNSPEIWEYIGYETSAGSFAEYLTGRPDEGCGDHLLINTSAGYRATVNSVGVHSPDTDTPTPVTVLTISVAPKMIPIHRTQASGQQQAFERLFSLIEAGLSHHIDAHTGPIGDTQTVPDLQDAVTRHPDT